MSRINVSTVIIALICQRASTKIVHNTHPEIVSLPKSNPAYCLMSLKLVLCTKA